MWNVTVMNDKRIILVASMNTGEAMKLMKECNKRKTQASAIYYGK